MNQTKPTKTEAPAPRRYHSPADKVRILRLHLLEGPRDFRTLRGRRHPTDDVLPVAEDVFREGWRRKRLR